MTRRRWIADTWDQKTASLHGEQALHLSRVLRAQSGMEFDVVAGGSVWLARITSVEKTGVHFALLAELETAPTLPLTVLLSVFKFDRMEWAIEKAVELGASRIIPVLAERTEKHLAQAAPKRVERWRRLALEAAKQARRSDLPQIDDPIRLATLLADDPGMVSTGQPADGPLRILLSEVEDDQSLLRTVQQGGEGLREILFAVGPEGGWTAPEIASFTNTGWESASLGPRILRVETAVIAALAIIDGCRSSVLR